MGNFVTQEKHFYLFATQKSLSAEVILFNLDTKRLFFLQKIKKFLAQSTTDSFFLPTRGTFALATIGEKA